MDCCSGNVLSWVLRLQGTCTGAKGGAGGNGCNVQTNCCAPGFTAYSAKGSDWSGGSHTQCGCTCSGTGANNNGYATEGKGPGGQCGPTANTVCGNCGGGCITPPASPWGSCASR